MVEKEACNFLHREHWYTGYNFSKLTRKLAMTLQKVLLYYRLEDFGQKKNKVFSGIFNFIEK